MVNNRVKELIKEFSFFRDIDEERINELCENTSIVELETDSILLRKGEPCHKGMYLICEGEILVENPEKSVVYKAEKGDVVGITAFLGRRTYAVNAKCIKNSELIYLPDI